MTKAIALWYLTRESKLWIDSNLPFPSDKDRENKLKVVTVFTLHANNDTSVLQK